MNNNYTQTGQTERKTKKTNEWEKKKKLHKTDNKTSTAGPNTKKNTYKWIIVVHTQVIRKEKKEKKKKKKKTLHKTDNKTSTTGPNTKKIHANE